MYTCNLLYGQFSIIPIIPSGLIPESTFLFVTHIHFATFAAGMDIFHGVTAREDRKNPRS